MLEEQMGDQIYFFLQKSGYEPFVQIPIFYGRIDFVGIKNNECMVIESKVNKWKYGLKQVLKYGYGAEKSYIALPSPTAHYVYENYEELFNKYKIGLLEINEGVNILIPCSKKEFSPVYKNIIISEIMKRKRRSQQRISTLKRRYDI